MARKAPTADVPEYVHAAGLEHAFRGDWFELSHTHIPILPDVWASRKQFGWPHLGLILSGIAVSQAERFRAGKVTARIA